MELRITKIKVRRRTDITYHDYDIGRGSKRLDVSLSIDCVSSGDFSAFLDEHGDIYRDKLAMAIAAAFVNIHLPD